MATDPSAKSQWLDENSNLPNLAERAQGLESFMTAIADGRVTDDELKAQEQRLAALMKEIEPQLEPKLRDRVTELLCELTAYDLMQMLHLMQQSKPKTAFRG